MCIGLSTYLTVQDTFVSQTLSTSDRSIFSHDRYGHSNPISDARILVFLAPSHSYYPPWNLKLGGLESSGPRLISSIGKTKRIAFFLAKKKYFQNFQIFWKKRIFLDFLRFFEIFDFFWYFPIFWVFFMDILSFLGFLVEIVGYLFF